MIKLIPDWCKHFDEFWESIRKRNLLFIKLRFLAAFALLIFALFSSDILAIHFEKSQRTGLLLLAISLLLYNAFLYAFRNKLVANKISPVHFSIFQMIVDLIILSVIVHLTGGIESPFLPFYIFHMIIGSLILPACIIYLSAFVISIIITGIAYAEYHGILTHHCVYGLLNNAELYKHIAYINLTLTTFVFTLFFSVFLANYIARQLYVQEEHLIKSLEELKNSNAKKQKYIMGVMHEIKSPIAASQSITDLILGGYLGEVPENIREKIERIKKRNSEAVEMINDILRISRVHLLGENQLEEIDPQALLEKEKEKIMQTAQGKNITVRIKPPKGKPAKLKGDARVISLALSNIFGNAVKYTPENGTIEAEIVFKKNYLEIRICDNGKGIPQQELEKVFTPFYRLKRDKGKTEGSGLGLALVKEIVNQHNGEILLESPSPIGDKQNPGTCCLLRLPYSPNENTALNVK